MTTTEGQRGSARLDERSERVGTRLAPLRSTIVIVGWAVILTAVVALDTRLRFAYLNAELRVALETTAALVGFFVGLLAIGRFRSTRSLGDLALALGIIVLALASMAFAALPRSVGGADSEAFATWASLIARLIGAAMLATAAFTIPRTVRRVRVTALVIGVTALMSIMAGAAWVLAGITPDGVRIEAALADSARPLVDVRDG